MPPKLKHFLLRLINCTIGVVAASYVVRGIQWQKPLDLVMAAFLLGILNTFVRPLLLFLSLPVLIFTLGLFTFVINGLLLYFVGWLMQPYFEVANFWAAFWGALVITIVATILNGLTGTGNARLTVRRGGTGPH